MWVALSKFPGVTMTVEHVIESAADGTVLIERAIMSGPLGGVMARLIGGRLEKDFAGTTARIARLAEARPAR